MVNTQVSPAQSGIKIACQILHEGGMVALPTETVYGLGADASNKKAVAKIFAAKGRPQKNPLIVHVSNIGSAENYGIFDKQAYKLAENFWPGPLTLVLPKASNSSLAPQVSPNLNTVALRVPSHPIFQDVLSTSGLPVAAPSANKSGEVSPTTAEHVLNDLNGAIDLILDSGPCELGVESTVVMIAGSTASLLRPGMIQQEDIEKVLGASLVKPHSKALHGPGMLSRHYAPRAKLRLDALSQNIGEALLAFGPTPPNEIGLVKNLSQKGDLIEAAANLYACLRELDDKNVGTISVMPIPESGIGIAINDRLRRAAAKKT